MSQLSQLADVDISQPLLSSAYQSATHMLSDFSIPVVSIEADFYRLPNFMHFFEIADNVPRRCVASMFGGTFGNLENEILFARNGLVGFKQGSLLLLEVMVAFAPATRPELVQQRDPTLLMQRPPEWQRRFEDWLTGPIRRYGKEITSISVQPRLDVHSCSVPGSYAIDWRATVKTRSRASKEFSIAYFKRYDIEKLAECLRQEGWERIEHWTYGDVFPMSLGLYRRIA